MVIILYCLMTFGSPVCEAVGDSGNGRFAERCINCQKHWSLVMKSGTNQIIAPANSPDMNVMRLHGGCVPRVGNRLSVLKDTDRVTAFIH